jgi:hypothetical protein
MEGEHQEEINSYLNDTEARMEFFMQFMEGFIEDGDKIKIDNLLSIYSEVCGSYLNVETPTNEDIAEARSELKMLDGGKDDEYISLEEFKNGNSRHFIGALKIKYCN